MASPRDLLNAAKSEIREIDPHDVAADLSHYTILDVREPDEYEQGAVPGAVHIPRGNLEFSVEGRLLDKNAPVAVPIPMDKLASPIEGDATLSAPKAPCRSVYSRIVIKLR